MPREILEAVVSARARELASQWLGNNMRSRSHADRWRAGPEFVLQELYNYTFKDEFTFIYEQMQTHLAGAELDQFRSAATQRFAPREDAVFHQLLADKLAIDPEGKHIPGKIGSTVVDGRRVGFHGIEREHPLSIRLRKMQGLTTKAGRFTMRRLRGLDWPIYAGEDEEREADSGIADAFPLFAGLAAIDYTIGNAEAIDAVDVIVDRLDGGDDAAVISTRTGAKPADVDTTVSGTQLSLHAMNDPAFGPAADDTGSALATANAIGDDTSIDATGTIGYARVSSTNDGTAPIDDHMDLNAGTSNADLIVNTISYVAGGTATIDSFTVRLNEQA